jgi:hypothetical protein
VSLSGQDASKSLRLGDWGMGGNGCFDEFREGFDFVRIEISTGPEGRCRGSEFDSLLELSSIGRDRAALPEIRVNREQAEAPNVAQDDHSGSCEISTYLIVAIGRKVASLVVSAVASDLTSEAYADRALRSKVTMHLILSRARLTEDASRPPKNSLFPLVWQSTDRR